MAKEHGKHSTVGKTYEIDQRAIKVFLSWLPDNWIPRKLDPDFFIDYLVEITENGEPTGKQFCVQVKGYGGVSKKRKPLSYRFKTKHLKYYLNRSQHPVFLILINTITREGYWVFAQKYLKEKVSPNILERQHKFAIRFSPEDSLFNSNKFTCLLPEAECFVRDLHPGSIHAAVQKQKTELEARDPRCVVEISFKDGQVHTSIVPKETFSFKTLIHSKNIESWQKIFERGAEIELKPGELEIIGAPLLEEIVKKADISKIQFGKQYPASIQVFYGTPESPSIVPIEGIVNAGTKFMTFNGALPEAPLAVTGEFPLSGDVREQPSIRFQFSLDKWIGQSLNLLSHFDQIEGFVRSIIATRILKFQVMVRGNNIWDGQVSDYNTGNFKDILFPIEWIQKCRWIAQHYQVNPVLPSLAKVPDDKWSGIEDLYLLLKNKERSVPAPGMTLTYELSDLTPVKELDLSGSLMMTNENQTEDFLGIQIPLGPMRHTFNNVRFVSRTPVGNGKERFVFATTDKTMQTRILL